MAGSSEAKRRELIELLSDFDRHLTASDLRGQVQALIPVYHRLRDLGGSLLQLPGRTSAIERVLSYLRRHPGIVIAGDELMVVSGIQDYPRRIRQLRKESGWPILSGTALHELLSEEPGAIDAEGIAVDDYILLRDEQDRDAAHRWHIANGIRRGGGSPKANILRFLLENVGAPVTAEELRYVANDNSDWARRTRELRTQDGWSIATKLTGRPDLPPAVYVLEHTIQAEPHDRNIPDSAKTEVLIRDGYSCRFSGCDFDARNPPPGPHRRIEFHHIVHHARGGTNDPGNLVTLCNVHHDVVHGGTPLRLKPVPTV